MDYRTPDDFLAYVAARDPHQPEFLQAVKEVLLSLWPFLLENPRYARHALLNGWSNRNA